MAESRGTLATVVGAGIGLVALGSICSLTVIIVDEPSESAIGYQLAFQLFMALGYGALALAYRSLIRSVSAGEAGAFPAGAMRVFATANLLFALAYLASSFDYLQEQFGRGYVGRSLIVWSIGQVAACIGFAVASVGLWLSARAVNTPEVVTEGV